jgi:light-regulated signal transduction histidine kinase (bacteriophytochrome)
VDGLSAACNLNDALHSAQNDVALVARLSDCSWLTIKSTPLSSIKGSAAMWQMYFIEMLNNVTFYAFSRNAVTCSIYMELMADSRVLVIEDDGIVLSMDEVTKATQPFRSLHSPESDVSEVHDGMGLSLAKRVVDMHHGQFIVCARPDGFPGLRVEARLPYKFFL